MRPSINYDHLTHGDHIHWCSIEALGVTRDLGDFADDAAAERWA